MNTVRTSLVLLVAAFLGSCQIAGASNLPTSSAAPGDSGASGGKAAASTRVKPASKPNKKAKDAEKSTDVAAQSKLDKTPDVSGTWVFSSTWRDWHKGTITLKQDGTKLTGMWHTVEGKKEDDLPLFGEVVGDTVYITRYGIWGKTENQNKFTLNMYRDGKQLFGYGEGFFIHHADLNMARMDK
jgi:hypothetical protein